MAAKAAEKERKKSQKLGKAADPNPELSNGATLMPEPRQPVASEAGRFDAGEQEPIL
jgi:hypothetical protein